MKKHFQAISIKQPWAWLIVKGYKTIENRTWKTNYRGTVLIHAGKGFDLDGYEEIKEFFPKIQMPGISDFKRGGIVGEVFLADCVTEHSSPWFSGPYGFVFTGPCELNFTPCKGQLGFFKFYGKLAQN